MLSKYNFRGIVGVDLKEKNIKQFAKSIVQYINKNNLSRTLLLAKDNRESGDYILSVINSVFCCYGVEVHLLGVATTPMLVYLTSRFKFGLGIMITASHNSKECNGFKVFDNFGESVDVCDLATKICASKQFVKTVDGCALKDVYWRELKNSLNANSIKCVFDCANGASFETVRKLFPRHQIIGTDKTGLHINDNYGTQDLRNIQALCKRGKKIGFAFDGDGDRVVAIDKNGKVVDGDKIIYILATQKLGFGDKAVGTQISSLALEVSLRRLGVGLIRERVGAKYVARRMKEENIAIGGESCGHIFLKRRVSDGIGVVIELLNILNRTGLDFEQLLSGYKKTFILNKDVAVDDIKNLKEFDKIDGDTRVVVRRSMTEDKIRVLVEGENEKMVEKIMQNTIDEIIGRAL